MKPFSRTIFIAYLLVLSWLVLFKFSYDILSVIATFHTRSLNLIPFAGNGRREMLENMIVFVPFGLLLSANLKRTIIWRRLALIFSYSLAIELAQFVLAIGRTDITDVIMNTAGGFLGITLYELGKKYIDDDNLDQFIGVVVGVFLVVVVMLRAFVFKVRY